MKRLGDFLNMESFDLALLEEVGCMELLWNPGWEEGWPRDVGSRRRLPSGGRARQITTPFPPGVE